MKARVAAYAGLQLRDYFTGRAWLIVAVTVAAAWAYAAATGLTVDAFDSSAGVDARAALQRAFAVLLTAFAFAAAAVSVQGLVARDRRRGYDHLVFSRALSPTRYYLQGFALAGAGGALLGAAAAEVYAVAVHPVSVVGVAGYVALTWICIGGLGFALSILTRFHVLLVALLVAADFALDRLATAMRAAGAGNAFVDAAAYVLPPGHVIASLSETFARGDPFDARLLVWPIAFGLACVGAALILLRRRPFGS